MGSRGVGDTNIHRVDYRGHGTAHEGHVPRVPIVATPLTPCNRECQFVTVYNFTAHFLQFGLYSAFWVITYHPNLQVYFKKILHKNHLEVLDDHAKMYSLSILLQKHSIQAVPISFLHLCFCHEQLYKICDSKCCISDMTYIVSSGTLNLNSINQSTVSATVSLHRELYEAAARYETHRNLPHDLAYNSQRQQSTHDMFFEAHHRRKCLRYNMTNQMCLSIQKLAAFRNQATGKCQVFKRNIIQTFKVKTTSS